METQTREVEIAQSAIAELLKRHRQQGHNMLIFFQSLVSIGAHSLAVLVGGERASEIIRNVADSQALRAKEAIKGLNAEDPSEDDHRAYTAAALDGAPPNFDRNMVYACGLIHCGLSIAALMGAKQALTTLRDVSAQIERLAVGRQVRTGEPRRDAN